VRSSGQKIIYLVADVTNAIVSKDTFYEAIKKQEGQSVDHVFLCAGAAIPGLFCQQPLDDFTTGINLNYLGSLYTAKVIEQSRY
jgi:NADP-dependent 3-hydroxy acid dehydrogenase YdfG